MGKFNLLDWKFDLTQSGEMAFWEEFSTQVMARDRFRKGKDHPISHRAIYKEKIFKKIPKEKHLC